MAGGRDAEWGIRIVHYIEKDGQFNTYFHIGKRKKIDRKKTGEAHFNEKVIERFITNKEIQGAVNEHIVNHDGLRKTGIGYMTIEMRPLGGSGNQQFRAEWQEYHPFGHDKDRRGIYLGKGIAQRLEYIVLQELKRQYPDTKVIKHHNSPDRPRIIQLKKRGLEPNKEYPLDYEIGLLKAKIAKDAQHRWPRHKKVKSKLRKSGKKVMRK
ncbi:MAG: hypothetical protein ABID38_07035 [Candidatus Diapherotrites archaeon]